MTKARQEARSANPRQNSPGPGTVHALEVAGRMLKTLKSEDVVTGILELAQDMIPADGWVIWRKDEGTGRWIILVKQGLSDGFVRVLASRALAHSDMRPGQHTAFGVENVSEEPWSDDTAQACQTEGISALLIAPMVFQSTPVGAVTFFFRSPRKFETSELKTASVVGNMAAGALMSSDLFEKRRAGFLVGIVFDSSQDYKKTLSGLAALVVPYFADGCAVDLFNEENVLESETVVHVDHKTSEAVQKFRTSMAPPTDGTSPYALALRTGQSTAVAPGGPTSFLDSYSPPSALIVPIRIRDRTMGMITFVNIEAGRHFTGSDLLLAEDLARRAALSIDNIRLLQLSRESLDARETVLLKLQKQIKQQAALMAITQAGLSKIDPASLLEDTVFWLAKTLQVLHCVVLESSPGSAFSIRAALGWKPEAFAQHLEDPEVDQLFRRALESYSPVVYGSRLRDDAGDGGLVFRDEGLSSAVLVPFRRPGETSFGLIAVFSETANAFSQDDIQFLQSITNVVASAVGKYETEKALSTSEQKYRQLFDISPNGILLANAGFRVTSANAEALKIFRFDHEDKILGTDLRNYIFPQDEARNPTEQPVLPLKHDIRDAEMILTRSDGTRFPAEVSAEAISSGGIQVAFFAIVRDITSRAELDRMKTEFITTVSHELRTPLTSIFVSLELMAKGRVPLASVKAATLLEVAYKNCKRLMALINDFLDFQKIHSSKIDLLLVETDLGPLVRQAVDLNQSYAEQYEVKFELDFPTEDFRAVVDIERFLQVLANLLSNAAKFSPRTGVVTIGLQKVDAAVRVSVVNHGPMIPETARSKLFEKFAQVDSTLNRKHRGSGLGLAISRSLVEKMGGVIDYRSNPLETVFYVDLPGAWHSVAAAVST